jgi:hypothetical protein
MVSCASRSRASPHQRSTVPRRCTTSYPGDRRRFFPWSVLVPVATVAAWRARAHGREPIGRSSSGAVTVAFFPSRSRSSPATC